MTRRPFPSVTEQVADSLSDGIRQGRWRDALPGRVALARELGVNHKTVEAALNLLEKTGMLERQGSGKGRKIKLRETNRPTAMRIVMLAYEKGDLETGYLVEIFHRLQLAGHFVSFASKTLCGVGMDVKRVARFVNQTEADAWIVVAGSREILEWFSTQREPAFGLFGQQGHVDIAVAGPNKVPAYVHFVDRLVELGHRRIVMLARSVRRLPSPGFLERLFLDHLAGHGIATSSYHLPHWDDTPEGFHRCLDSLFHHTPPTALILDEPSLFFAAQQHLATAGLIAPRDVSLVCTDQSRDFEWCRPTVAHIRWEPDSMVKRVVAWADHVGRGKEDRRKTAGRARFVEGGTIGPVRGKWQTLQPP